MRHSSRCVPIFLALLACFTVCCHVSCADSGERPADEIKFERMQIHVQFEDGTNFSLMVDPEDSVRDLTYDISEYESVSSVMRLRLGDNLLTYAQQLSELNIQADTMFTLVIPEHRDNLTGKFTVRTRDGRRVPVETSLGTSVAGLKEKIEQGTSVPVAEQRLLLRGKELRDERKLAQYETNEDGPTTIDLGEPLEDCRDRVVTIFVKTPSGATLEVAAVNLADTVADLKEKIRERTGAPASVQRLFAANEHVITGEDHLCDLGLEAGSTVYMFFYSSRITSLDQVARLHGAVGATHKAPIFREAHDEGELARAGPASSSLYKDTRNWIARRVSRPRWTPGLFDPVARLDPNPDDMEKIKEKLRELRRLSLPNASESDRLQALVVRAQIKLSSAVRAHRVAANVSSSADSKQPGITLGGGGVYTDAIPLGADVNNWAPDALSDSDLMRLFEVSERVRQVQASGAQAIEGTLSIPSQGRINRAILMTYLEALAGYSPAVECNHDASEHEYCGICRDELAAEAAIKLPCGHALHADCILSWASKLYEAKHFPSCPICRQRFMFPYEALGKAELGTPELQGNRDEE